ncbi:MAG TPA: 16S rRNA (cytosine(1402)-N(4))-methyltransferase RsmH [Candidatus Binataceae bacterium]|nr:16S rRNA (cytosine(1402)-N(4))-methyltransferase RsmH [Candidatus Binataceae bacterium]
MALLAATNGSSERPHVPVMLREVCELIRPAARALIVDATVGAGGYAQALLEATEARLIGIDRDPRAIETATSRLAAYGGRVTLTQADFADLERVIGEAEPGRAARADAIVADLGMSSLALDDPARGFSFRLDGPLDMRMDPGEPLRAYDIVNEEGEVELARIIYEFGEERASRRIARMIVAARRRHPIETTAELRAIVERAAGGRRSGKIHPATRTFQALRIAVNHELESLAILLERGPMMLDAGGRMAIVAYHSLEDRAIKERFRALAREGGFRLLTPKALRPAPSETASNPRARSARLRCIERSA